MSFICKAICKIVGEKNIKRGFVFAILPTIVLSCTGTERLNHFKPEVYVNHVYLTLDSMTYSSISNSTFLKDFANCITKTISADSNQSWTGTYIWGENTYVEFFDIGEYENKGFSGIGFGIEIEHGIDSLYKHFTAAGEKNVSKDLRYRQIDNQEIPWFHIFGIYDVDSTAVSVVNSWVMEYSPDYLKYKYPDKNPDSLNVTRKCYNQEEYRSDLLLKDIVEVELALNEYDHNKFYGKLEKYGYQMEQQENLIIGNGPDIRLILRAASENESGICRIKFSLSDKPYESRTLLFGSKSKLILNADRTADWFFSI